MLRKLAHQILPPILWTALSRHTRSGPDQWTGLFDSIAQATHATGALPYDQLAQQADYIDRRLAPATAQLKLDIKHLGMLAALQHCLARSSAGPINIIDFGGGLGLHYHGLRQFLPDDAEIAWHVVELPEIVAEGRRRASPAELGYFENLDAAAAACGSGVEMIIASGVVQSVMTPARLIAEFGEIAHHVLLANLPLIEFDRDFVAVNSSHSPPYPLWFFAAEAFHKNLAGAGFRTVLAWNNPDTFWMVNGRRTPPAFSCLLSGGPRNARRTNPSTEAGQKTRDSQRHPVPRLL